MIRAIQVLVAAGLAMSAPAGSLGRQDPPSPKSGHTSTDPYKCKVCAPALAKALQYLEKRGSGNSEQGAMFMGFLYMADGRHPKEFERAVSRVGGGFCKGGGGHPNWGICMGAVFLSEVYRRAPGEGLRAKLLDVLKIAEKNMEPSGGWCHHLGFAAETGYDKQGGGTDLGILTAMMYSALLTLKKAGLPVSQKMFEAVEKNIAANSDGMGITYGTSNSAGDVAMGRGAWAYLGIRGAHCTRSKLFTSVPQGLEARYKQTHTGHAYPPLHFASVAMAMHLLGPETYSKFADHWIDQLIALQKEDGSIELPHSEGKELQKDDALVSSTAVFAMILVLQRPGLLEKPAAWLGVRVSAAGEGASVSDVAKDSPAAGAGIRVGDRIVELDGKKVAGVEELRALLDRTAVGKAGKLVVLRDGKRESLTVTPVERPHLKPEDEAAKSDEM